METMTSFKMADEMSIKSHGTLSVKMAPALRQQEFHTSLVIPMHADEIRVQGVIGYILVSLVFFFRR